MFPIYTCILRFLFLNAMLTNYQLYILSKTKSYYFNFLIKKLKYDQEVFPQQNDWILEKTNQLQEISFNL